MTVVFSSAARTTTTNSDPHHSPGAKGMRFVLDITAASGTSPTLDVTIESNDPLTGKFTAITDAAFAQKTAAGTDTLTIYPGITAAANDRVSDVMPDVYRAVATIGGTGPSFTFSLSAEEYG